MGFKRFVSGVTCAALMATMTPLSVQASVMPQDPPGAAGALNPAAESAPRMTAEAPQFQMADGILATVNDSVITGYDLRQRMLLLILQAQVEPTEENLPAIQREALNAMIEERLQMQELAKYAGDLTVTDAEVDEELQGRAAEAGTTAEAYMAFLAEGGIQPATIREQLRTSIGWQRLVGGRFQSRARVSQAQVQQTLRQLTENAAKPQYLVGEIFIDATRYGGQQAAMTGANSLIQQMIGGAPFQGVATQFSSAPSASRGGDAGWVVQGTVLPELEAAMAQLDVGELSRPIPVEGGVWIIYMRDKRRGAASSLASLKQVMVELPETASEAEVQAATARLTALQPQLTCENMLARATSEAGLLGSDLGEAEVENMAPQFQQIARSAEIGSISSPVRTPLGLHLVAVCGRRVGATDVPTAVQVENSLFRQNLSMLSRRYLRDLRADALIEIK